MQPQVAGTRGKFAKGGVDKTLLATVDESSIDQLKWLYHYYQWHWMAFTGTEVVIWPILVLSGNRYMMLTDVNFEVKQ